MVQPVGECNGVITQPLSICSESMKLVHWLTVDGWDVTFGTVRRGLGGVPAHSGPSSLYVPNVTVHPSTASVSIMVLLYNCLLLYSFNVAIKG